MEDQEAKKLRDSLMEYEGYLREMRQITLKNVETLDVIQRYTDKSAAGMQKLAEQSLEGVQKVTAESAGGLRRIIETGTSNLNQAAEANTADLNRVTEDCMNILKNYTEEGMNKLQTANEKNLETAASVEKIEQAILEHLDAMKALAKQSDEFNHRENVKVYRNVQAVVVEEANKQMEAVTQKNAELVQRNEALAKQSKGLKPLVIITLLASLANIGMMAAHILGLL